MGEADRESSGLNSAQQEVVDCLDGPVLVIAGAGSGKTKTLVHRVARLIDTGVNPESVLLLTFTRKSAQEMLHRAGALLDSRCHHVAGGTFHGFAHLMLRRFASTIGYPANFTILDRGDSEDLMQMGRRLNGVDKTEKRFPKKNTLVDVMSKSVNTGRDLGTIVATEFPHFQDYTEDILAICRWFVGQKREMGVMDYDDLLVQLMTLIRDHPDVKAWCDSQFSHIMVDEYQDTNHIQSDIIRQLAGFRQNICVVGDDSQSIYSFRGANYKNIMNFPQLFSGTKIITLAQNYRSTQPILDLTNAVIAMAKTAYKKSLFTDQSGGSKPYYVEMDDDHSQSQFVASKIGELVHGGTPLSKIAILVRSGWHSNDLEVELKSRELPFVKFGGFRFVESSHIKDVMALMRLAENSADQIGWMRILQLIDGVGPKASATLGRIAHESRESWPNVNWGTWKNKPFIAQLNELISALSTPVETVVARLQLLIGVYTPWFRNKYDDYSRRTSDLESVVTIAKRYTSLSDFLSEMALDPPEMLSADSGADDERLTISTIHSAKGLEWDVVFLISAVDGYLPSCQSMSDLAALEEERRLVYVALTRAKKILYIIKPNLDFSPNNHYRFSSTAGFSQLCRFLNDDGIIRKYAQTVVTPPGSRSYEYSPGKRQFSSIFTQRSSKKYQF